MKVTIGSLLAKIEKLFTCVEISFDDEKCLVFVPTRHGIYYIETDAPLNVLLSLGKPPYAAHIDIPRTIRESAQITERGLTIIQHEDTPYIVYNGEAQNLKARAREHVRGHC